MMKNKYIAKTLTVLLSFSILFGNIGTHTIKTLTIRVK